MFGKAKAYIRQRELELGLRAKLLDRAGVGVSMPDAAPGPVGFLVVETRAVDPQTGQPDGEWREHAADPNLVVSVAEQIMAQMAIGGLNSALSYIELGDKVTPSPPQLTDLGLEQTTGQRKALATLTASGNIVTASAVWLAAEGNGFNYTEAGLFNGLLASGLMFARKVFAPIAKTNAFELRFTWYITFLVNTQGGDCAGVSLVGPASVTAFTVYVSPAGGQNSVAATFDFTVGANHVDVFVNGVRLIPGVDYTEVGAGVLTAPVGGPPGNKGVNFVGFSLNPADEVFLIQRTLA